ncbi:MAG: AAA family ATPase [Spirochaetes bacterium]|nr:AAA family ATPase [Spirochaetota bacterium]
MVKRIALFNHKGGVSKTTTTFNLGWMLASKGKRVIMVDADPQCNLTGLVLGYKGLSELDNYYQKHPERNLQAALAPAFESRPKEITAVECIETKGRRNLFLLPGSIKLSEYEVTLGIAQELSGSIQTLQNLPGSFSYVLAKTAEAYNADYILLDMNPSLSSINQNLLLTSDYFLIPTSPDYFSVMALDSLSTVIPRWADWSRKAQTLQILTSATYPFPNVSPKFLGIIIQKYRPRSGVPAKGFQKWVNEIKTTVTDKLSPVLNRYGLLLPESTYKEAGVGKDFCLSEIADFNTLIAKSQSARTPIYALSPKQIGSGGIILKNTIKSRDAFKGIFNDLATTILALTR